jgi:hypothetical protein
LVGRVGIQRALLACDRGDFVPVGVIVARF